MQFRVINEGDELTILTEDGGIVCIREAEPISNPRDVTKEKPRIAVTDYYQSRITEEEITPDNVFEILAEGNMYHNDWATTKFNDIKLIQDALEWLCPTETTWEMVDDLFVDLFGPH